MASLDRTLRRQLENTVKQARRVAEAGARKAVEQLAVHQEKSWPSMTREQQQLHRRLRAHGKQLGDTRDAKGAQSVSRLVGECAYEHWHRMLFARFLAENDLLIEPEHGVAISLEDCRELARDLGKDWLELGSAYAVRMLPQIFRTDDPVLEVNLPPETRSELEDLLKALPRDVFLADDSLGWVYQFWQADQKDAVNKSEKKIGADELPAVTQLFTEDYMVEFLLHNTLGAWWAGKVLAANPELANNAKDEDELRAACAVGDITWTYLRFVKVAEASSLCNQRQDAAATIWRPAAGVFPHWPKSAAELRVLDPCCGSGHFMVFALPILIAMRMEKENLSTQNACDAVLRDNLFGLELDSRCTQIAAFNLALAAWKATGYHTLPRLQIACSGLSVGASKEAWLKLARGHTRLESGLGRLYETFRFASTLGSLIDPRIGEVEAALFEATLDELRPILDQTRTEAYDSDTREAGVTAEGLIEAVRILSESYSLVVTNVPFLTQLKFSNVLEEYVSQKLPAGRFNLATAMMCRLAHLSAQGGAAAFVAPQSWWFLKRYEAVRKLFLKETNLRFLVRLGEKAFESPQAGGEIVGLSVISNSPALELDDIVTLDVSNAPSPGTKAEVLKLAKPEFVRQSQQLANPNSVILFVEFLNETLLREQATALRGIGTGDAPQFVRSFTEVCSVNSDWEFHQTTVSNTSLYGGMTEIILWEEENGRLAEFADQVKHLNHAAQNWRRGKPNWGKRGVAISQMGTLPACIYTGERYDPNCTAIVPEEEMSLLSLWAFAESGELTNHVRQANQNRKVEVATFLEVPFDLKHWQKVASDVYPNGLPEPFSDDPTQWIFHGHPCGSVGWNELTKRLEVASTPRTDTTVLQVAVARLLGYRWPAELDAEMRLSDESRMVVARCADLHRFADKDGIVCLSPIHKEAPAAQRLTELLAAAYGEHWSAARLNELLAAADCKGKTLDDWLRDKFFEQHCSLFYHRPFIWHIWDGLRDGFNALVNYHKLAAPNGEGRRTLEKLIYTYLGDWITQQRREQQAGAEGADARLAAALHLQDELKKILQGEPPYDLFVRWKPLHEQPIGWDPDINDGVRLNIRPFMTTRPSNARAKNACILRTTPKNIKWAKDRGKEPERDKDDYPWFWGWDEKTQDFPGNKTFDGNRWNELHYTNAFKKAARDTHKEKK